MSSVSSSLSFLLFSILSVTFLNLFITSSFVKYMNMGLRISVSLILYSFSEFFGSSVIKIMVSTGRL